MPDHTPPERTPRQGSWRDCANGELTQFAQQFRSRRKLDRVNRIATVSLVLLVGVVIAFTAGQHYTSKSAQIDCSEVHSHMPQYLAGNLGDDLNSRIDNHLGYCLGCSEEFYHRTDIAVAARRNSEVFVIPLRKQSWTIDVRGGEFLELPTGSGECHCPECWKSAVRLTDK